MIDPDLHRLQFGLHHAAPVARRDVLEGKNPIQLTVELDCHATLNLCCSNHCVGLEFISDAKSYLTVADRSSDGCTSGRRHRGGGPPNPRPLLLVFTLSRGFRTGLAARPERLENGGQDGQEYHDDDNQVNMPVHIRYRGAQPIADQHHAPYPEHAPTTL